MPGEKKSESGVFSHSYKFICRSAFPLLLKSTEVPFLRKDVPLSTLVSVGSALGGLRCRMDVLS